MALTPRMTECLQVIRTYTAAHGRTPTYREIAAAMNLKSSGPVVRLVDCLVARGYVKRTKRASGKRRGARTLILCFGENAQPEWEGLAYAIIAEAKAMRQMLEQHKLPTPPKAFDY
jgi:SOS-response transcriptional repressor LexA